MDRNDEADPMEAESSPLFSLLPASSSVLYETSFMIKQTSCNVLSSNYDVDMIWKTIN